MTQDNQQQERLRMTAEALGQWRSNPVTRVVLGYLRDFRLQLSENVAAEIFNGRPVAKDYIEEVAFKCGVMQDVETLDADDINQFYGTPDEPQEKESPNGKI